MLNNLCCNNFPKKLIPGKVRAEVLQEPVGASHADQGRKSGVYHPFPDPGGQARSNSTPYGQCCLAIRHSPGGGSCSLIYIDSSGKSFFLLTVGQSIRSSFFKGLRSRSKSFSKKGLQSTPAPANLKRIAFLFPLLLGDASPLFKMDGEFLPNIQLVKAIGTFYSDLKYNSCFLFLRSSGNQSQ